MGADIHAYIEIRDRFPDEQWKSFSLGELTLQRDYQAFAALAGVRKTQGFSELIPPRGFPSDAAEVTFLDFHVPILEDHQAEQISPWHDTPCILRSNIPSNIPIVKRDGRDYADGDEYHSHSYLSLAEINECLAHAKLSLENIGTTFQATIAMMTTLEKEYDSRLVFWFDS